MTSERSSDAPPPFRRLGPDVPSGPVVISVPHAGRAYSRDLLNASRLPRALLEILEDRLVDQLVWRAVADGVPTLVADAPRAEIDLNRSEAELDRGLLAAPEGSQAELPSPARAGLGLIPSRIAGAGPIWRAPIPLAEAKRRIAAIHRPYHEALAGMLAAARARFGIAILLDCHSMPPRAAGEARIVLGDRHGSSIDPELMATAEQAAMRLGYKVARNQPYAGGHVTARHGRPREGFHAVQIEIDRSCYLDRALAEAGPGFDLAARLIADISRSLAQAASGPEAIAAE